MKFDIDNSKYYVTASDFNNTYTYNYEITYNYTYTSITYIGATAEETETYKLYYQLPDGRNSADLTNEDIAHLSVAFDIMPCGYINVPLECLPRKHKKVSYKNQRPARPPAGRSIERRPREVTGRSSFGHWEMDTVYGSGKTSLLVLTERKTRYEIIRKIPDRTFMSVYKVINSLERKLGKDFRKIFNTITVDNGGEFAKHDLLENSPYTKNPRTEIYYCHPRNPQERGSNENQNILIRRFVPKGSNIDYYKKEEIQYIQDWLNSYPRRLFNGNTANSLFKSELYKLGLVG